MVKARKLTEKQAHAKMAAVKKVRAAAKSKAPDRPGMKVRSGGS